MFWFLQTNTFQCILATTRTDSFVIFLYADRNIQWTTGDDSGGFNGLGGTEALAGINAGDGFNHTTIPGSLTPNIINIAQSSNVGIPGVWIFEVGEGKLCVYYVCVLCVLCVCVCVCVCTCVCVCVCGVSVFQHYVDQYLLTGTPGQWLLAG